MDELNIIYEDKDIIVVNKVAGLISEHSIYENPTLESLVYQHLLQSKPKPFVGIVHRLDRVTSGVLLFAKKKSVLVHFNVLFSKRKVRKTYLAIVENKPRKNFEVLDHFLVKDAINKKAKIYSTAINNAKKCSLTYRLINKNEFGYLLEVKPKTGRFHQIRAQLSHIGLPILGDNKYGALQEYLDLSVCLHASELSFPAKDSKEIKTFKANPPNNDFWEM